MVPPKVSPPAGIMDTYIVGKRHEIADRRRVSLADKSSISLLVNNLVYTIYGTILTGEIT